MAADLTVNRVNPRVDHRTRYLLTLFTRPSTHNSCRSQCTWTKTPGRKLRTDPRIDKQLRKSVTDFRHYADSLQSRMDECPNCLHRSIDIRATRPPDPDFLLGQEDDDDVMMEDDDEQGSDDENDPSIIVAICIPPLSLQVR